MGLTKESIIECLRESYGESVTSAEIKAFCQMNDFNYQTITNKLTDYKVGRGKVEPGSNERDCRRTRNNL